LVYKINSNQFLLLKADNATNLAKIVHEKYEGLFNDCISGIDEEA